MIIRILTCIALITLVSFNSSAQLREVISTDRPGQSFGQYTVGKKILQLQGGITYFDDELDTVKSSGTSENLMIRYGIAENFELSAVLSYTSDKVSEITSRQGVNQFDVGFKIHLFERASGFTGSWQNHVRLNAVADDFKSEKLGFNSLFSLGYPAFGGGFTFNGGVAWDGNNDGASFFYTFNYTHMLNDQWLIFLEPYGNYFNEWNTFIDAGVGFLINKDFQLDAAVGIDLSDNRELFFIDAGISYRILAFR